MMRLILCLAIVLSLHTHSIAQESIKQIGQRYRLHLGLYPELDSRIRGFEIRCWAYEQQVETIQKCVDQITKDVQELAEIYGSLDAVPYHLRPYCSSYNSPSPYRDLLHFLELLVNCKKKHLSVANERIEWRCHAHIMERELVRLGQSDTVLAMFRDYCPICPEHDMGGDESFFDEHCQGHVILEQRMQEGID